MKLSKKIISVILCVIMVFTMSAVAITANAKDDVTPVVFIPGIGQSQTYKYDDEGNEIASWNMLHVNTDFASFSIISRLSFSPWWGINLMLAPRVASWGMTL